MRYAALIDRDGTMGGAPAMRTPQEYTPFPGTLEAIRLLRENGILVLIVTNQSCIARHLDGGYDFESEFIAAGADDWFICPHDNADNCNCRKPKTGLFEAAIRKYGLKPENCFSVGDRWSDMLAGGRCGTNLIPVLTGSGEKTMTSEREKWQPYEPVFVARDLLDAAEYIVETVKNVKNESIKTERNDLL